jgi:hypothetical protein
MKKLFLWIFLSLILLVFVADIYYAFAYSIFIVLVIELFLYSNERFVFREWALLLYSLNYLVAPAITYGLSEEKVQYGMKIPSDDYFNLAFPGFLIFAIGMYIIPTKIFNVSTKDIDKRAILNKSFLVRLTIVGILTKLITSVVPGDIGFIFYLFSLLRFVSAFALLSIDKKNWYWTAIVLLMELVSAFLVGMYHDAIMWVVFFSLYFVYALKPSLRIKFIGAISIIAMILFIQAIKHIYRSEVWFGNKEASLTTAYDIGIKNSNTETILGEDNLLGTLNRGNQAWIFASTVDNLARSKNFQGLTNVNKYLEAALLPRFLAPNKIKSGDKEIFNEFSGHQINEGTSMGLGIFADGYIAYGAWGVYIFGFVLGLIFSLTFKLVERWSKISPFYVLLLLPLLNYAVRPDCELQTTINHLFKGILLYGFLVYLTRKRFTLDSQENQRKLLHLNLVKGK